jgi:hypothetical protein
MGMSADNRAVDEHTLDRLQHVIAGQSLEQALPDPRGEPTAEAVIDGVPFAEAGREVTPRPVAGTALS